jgi:uncharacterized protein YlzI (FlbEa/FlbD family)
MALIQISDNVHINTLHIDSVEAKKDKTWVSVGSKSYTVDMTIREFLNKVAKAEQSSGSQHFAG